jgi:mycothiol synthase
VDRLRAVAVDVVVDRAQAAQARTLLDQVESAAAAPLVDEFERARLEQLAHDPGELHDHWHALLARADEALVGYAGITVRGVAADAELVVDRSAGIGDRVRASLSDGVRRVALDHGAQHVVLWLRHVESGDAPPTWAEHRRLDVLGRVLDDSPPANVSTDVVIRPYREGDDDAVVALLAAAFAGTPDAGWDHDRLRQRRTMAWYDPDDLLVATLEGTIVGVHWTKRRGLGVGEVYVLAVDPRTTRRGIGRALLRAGLLHLRERGCDDVLLWVDEDNAPAQALYRAEGFTRRWLDVAYTLAV